MKIEKVKITDIKPYKNNAKIHTREQIEQIKKSIQEFGNNDPIAIDEKNVIIEGHGRYYALKELGYDEVECIRLTHLTEEQKKAYILVHNKLTMNTDFDINVLNEELDEIINIDMEDYGFDFDEIFDIREITKENERERTYDTYNLDLYDPDRVEGKYQIPIIKNDNYIPKRLIGFNYAMSSQEKRTGLHFYLDDYQFERLWNSPREYIDILGQYECILSPDFSLYTDMSISLMIYNIYRSRLLGQFYQDCGIKVIPTISWCGKETYDFCFLGIPKGSVVSISTIGVKNSDEAYHIWKDGVDEMIKRIEPSAILIYGGKLDYDFKDIKVVYYDNEVTERMKGVKKK